MPRAKEMLSTRKIVIGSLASILLAVMLQPIYFIAVVGLDHVISHETTWTHIRDAFETGVLQAGRQSFLSQVIVSGDRFTDCYSLGVGLEPGVGPVVAGITAARPVSDRHACDDLKDASADPSSVVWGRYARYWHGYRLYSAPLASAFPILALKLINLLLLAASSAFFVAQSSRLLGPARTIALCAPVIFCSDYVRIWHVTPHTVSTVVIIGGAGLFAIAIRRRASLATLLLLSAAFGSIFNFVDFLVNPPWMPMLLAAFTMVAPGMTVRERIVVALLCTTAWFGAYGLTWSAKWVAAYLVDPGFDIKADVLSTAMFRIAGANEKVIRFPLVATIKMVGWCMASWGIGFFILFAIISIRAVRNGNFDRRQFLLLAWPALIPVLWFEVLSSHSQIHAFFVSRSEAAAIGVLFAAAFAAADVKSSDLVKQGAYIFRSRRVWPMIEATDKHV
jgi:hypothetical protein